MMPNQNECDHIIGFFGYCDIITKIKSKNIAGQIQQMKVRFSRLQKFTDLEVFEGRVELVDFCPNCGAKIDWVKIREELDDKHN